MVKLILDIFCTVIWATWAVIFGLVWNKLDGKAKNTAWYFLATIAISLIVIWLNAYC